MDNTQKDINADEYVYTWGLFACLEALDSFIHELKTHTKREKKQQLSKLKYWIDKWKANTNHKSRLQYATIARPQIEELSFLIMESIMFTSAIPLSQIDFFSEELRKLQQECIKREDERRNRDSE